MRILTKDSELFDKAIGDLWSAEELYDVRPDSAVWHCGQSVEKMLKGVLYCYKKDFDHTHELPKLLADCMRINISVTDDTGKNIEKIGRFSNSMRYVNRSTDPDKYFAKDIIDKTKEVIKELSELSKVKEPYQEALQLHMKILKRERGDNKINKFKEKLNNPPKMEK